MVWKHNLLFFIFLQAFLPMPELKSQALHSGTELFKITRNTDLNEIIYYLNTDATGQLDQQQPIEAYWLRYESGGEQTGRSLNALEKKYAYGLRFLEVTRTSATFQFVSYKRDLFFKRTSSEDVVMIEIDGKMLRLQRVHLQLGRGTFRIPEISVIELHAVDENGRLVVEVIQNPK